MQLFRSITTWLRENPETGAAEKTKTEDIIEAVNFTEAEKVAYTLAEKELRIKLGDVDIDLKRINNISDIIYQPVLAHEKELVEGLTYNFFEGTDDTGEGLYAVKAMFTEITEKGKEKRSNEILFVAASSNGDATKIAKLWLSKYDTRDFVVRDAKFDKASAILLTTSTYNIITDKAISA